MKKDFGIVEPKKITWPYFDEEHHAAVERVLSSGRVNYWTGDEGVTFENEFADFLGVKYAIAMSNGTVALDVALHAAGIESGDEVIVPTKTFIATASAVACRGAIPVVADVDKYSQNITTETIGRVITKKTKAIIVVHLGGWPCEMDEIMQFAEKHQLVVIEDCAQALGAQYKQRFVGGIGHLATHSFCQDKILTTGGEGGMLTCNDLRLWERAWRYKDHGKSPSVRLRRQNPGKKFRWVHEKFGSNFRLSEMQSAIGRVSLRRLPGWLKKRHDNANALSNILSKVSAVRIPKPPSYVYHAYYKYYFHLNCVNDQIGPLREYLMESVRLKKIALLPGSCSEIYREKAFRSLPARVVKLPVASELTKTSLMVPCDPTYSLDDMVAIGKVITAEVERYEEQFEFLQCKGSAA